MIKCPLTGSENTKVIYEQKKVPLIQNRVYPTKELAISTRCINVRLAQSLDNGFVFSAEFDDSIIDYDAHYQNEQSNSGIFQKHLENVIEILHQHEVLGGKVIEIGCGKAYFLNMLLEKGIDIMGFDPTYEGNSSKVIKDFFSEKYSGIGAELIILRHTLEHISQPFHFIKTIAAANNYKGKIFIEVPTFEWITKHNATEDIFYEHCNYFTLATLKMLFKDSIGGHFFNGQYIYVIADLDKVLDQIEKKNITPYEVHFDKGIEKYESLISGLDNLAVWGAGAKGSTFLNLIDPDARKVKCVVDINPKKQGQYIGGTGHAIIKPDELKQWGIENIVVMNKNYMEEIQEMIGSEEINLITL